MGNLPEKKLIVSKPMEHFFKLNTPGFSGQLKFKNHVTLMFLLNSLFQEKYWSQKKEEKAKANVQKIEISR